MRQLIAFLLTVLFATSCSSSNSAGDVAPPPEPEVQSEPTFDPSGTYDFSTSVEGQQVTGSFTISGSPGAYTGNMTSDVGGMAMRNISVSGTEVTFMGDMPDATVFVFLVFDGASFTGEWEAEGMMGTLSGSRR